MVFAFSTDVDFWREMEVGLACCGHPSVDLYPLPCKYVAMQWIKEGLFTNIC